MSHPVLMLPRIMKRSGLEGEAMAGLGGIQTRCCTVCSDVKSDLHRWTLKISEFRSLALAFSLGLLSAAGEPFTTRRPRLCNAEVKFKHGVKFWKSYRSKISFLIQEDTVKQSLWKPWVLAWRWQPRWNKQRSVLQVLYRSLNNNPGTGNCSCYIKQMGHPTVKRAISAPQTPTIYIFSFL